LEYRNRKREKNEYKERKKRKREKDEYKKGKNGI
jgi:hypothetical protein